MKRTYTTSRLPLITRDLQRFRGQIASVLRRQRDSAAVKFAAALITRDLLNYRATTGLTLDLFAESSLGRLRDANVNPLDLLQRVVEVYALRRDGEPVLDSQRVFQAFVARVVLRIAHGGLMGHGRKRPNAHQLRYVGSVIEEVLGQVPYAILVQVDKAAEERRAYLEACSDLAAAPPAPASASTRVYHGRTHSKRTHKGRTL